MHGGHADFAKVDGSLQIAFDAQLMPRVGQMPVGNDAQYHEGILAARRGGVSLPGDLADVGESGKLIGRSLRRFRDLYGRRSHGVTAPARVGVKHRTGTRHDRGTMLEIQWARTGLRPSDGCSLQV